MVEVIVVTIITGVEVVIVAKGVVVVVISTGTDVVVSSGGVTVAVVVEIGSSAVSSTTGCTDGWTSGAAVVVVSSAIDVLLIGQLVVTVINVVTTLVTVLDSRVSKAKKLAVGILTPLPIMEMLGSRKRCSLFSNWSCNSFNISKCFIAASSSASCSLFDG